MHQSSTLYTGRLRYCWYTCTQRGVHHLYPPPSAQCPREGNVIEIAVAQQFLRENENAVLVTWRRDGRLRMSPVTVGLDVAGRAIIASRKTTYKVRISAAIHAPYCASSSRPLPTVVQIEGTAEVVTVPEAMEPLVDYYRRLAGEHPDWDDYVGR